MHSATKYLNGHGDVVAGALVCHKKDSFWQKIRHNRTHGGAIPSPFDAWLLLRGMRTLFIRMEKINRSAMKIAKHFENNDHISEVLYPGLTAHKGLCELLIQDTKPLKCDHYFRSVWQFSLHFY